MSRILMLIPPRVYGPDEYGKIHPPLGALYVTATLEKDEHEVFLLDAFAEDINNRMYFDGEREFVGLNWNKIIHRVTEINPDFILVANIFTNFAKGAEKAVVLLKQHFEKIPLIMGGPHATLLNTKLLSQQPGIDYIITSEGEFSTRDLIRSLEHGKNDLSKISGLVWRSNGKPVYNPSNFVDEIDIFQFPARHLLNSTSYDQLSMMSPTLRSAEVITSRGCPWSCGFCSSTRIWGRRYRTRSIENVIQEIDLLRQDGINHLYFSDDSFNVNKKRTRKICEYLKNKNILWCCHQGMILSTISEDLLEDMAEAGMYCFVMPIESGNSDVLHKLINKSNNLDHIRRLAKKAKELGLYTIGYYILGLPTETKRQIQDTIQFAEELDLDYSTFTLFRPYPGTPLYDLAKKEGLLVGEEKGLDDFAYCDSRIHSGEYDEYYLERLRSEIWHKLSKPKFKTNIGNTDVYYSTIEPFYERFQTLFNKEYLSAV